MPKNKKKKNKAFQRQIAETQLRSDLSQEKPVVYPINISRGNYQSESSWQSWATFLQVLLGFLILGAFGVTLGYVLYKLVIKSLSG